MLPFAPDGRRLLDRDDNPWYPTSDWTSAVARAVTDLSALIAGRAHHDARDAASSATNDMAAVFG